MVHSFPTHVVLRWDERLYPGLRVEAVPAETRAELIQSLGALGVEAEHFLGTVRTFLAPPANTPQSRAAGELFLWQLESSAGRLRTCATTCELATQSYVAALDDSYADVRGSATASAAEPWWSVASDEIGDLSALDLRLRRCGFSYRHAVSARLASAVEAIAEHLSLLLHALDVLPPAGIVPVPALAAGLLELGATFQGHVVPHLLSDTGSDAPSLPSAIRRLRALDAAEDRSLGADLAWARAQLQDARAIAAQTQADVADAPARRGLLASLLRRTATPDRATQSTSREAWLAAAVRDWQATIAALESIQSQSKTQP